MLSAVFQSQVLLYILNITMIGSNGIEIGRCQWLSWASLGTLASGL